MSDPKKSSSTEQIKAESVIISSIEKRLGVVLEHNPNLRLTDKVSIRPDFYSASHCVVGEIFSHIGKMKGSQCDKISGDILKMLLLDKASNITHRKIIVTCCDDVMKQLTGNSHLAECIRKFGIELLLIPINEDVKRQIITTQARQKMVNE